MKIKFIKKKMNVSLTFIIFLSILAQSNAFIPAKLLSSTINIVGNLFECKLYIEKQIFLILKKLLNLLFNNPTLSSTWKSIISII